MKIFTCSACQQVLFFENTQCTKCGHALAYLPQHAVVSALEPVKDISPNEPQRFTALAPVARGAEFRLCRNYTEHAACNWAVSVKGKEEFCLACRLNETIPNLADAKAKDAWIKLERAKRRLLYTLIELGLPIESRRVRPQDGLAFAFLQDLPGTKVTTGHANGLITLNLAEADDSYREKMREELGEMYRTILGHFRHEIGHYYWDRLVHETEQLEPFRAEFGDERADYAAALARYYEQGAPPNWSTDYVSAYASTHPWEDWAETWAHYLHMADTLETARSYGLVLRPKPVGGLAPSEMIMRRLDFDSFDDLITAWMPLTVALNTLNRGMGLQDLYPFALSERAVRKLRFVHDAIEKSVAKEKPRAAEPTSTKP